MTKLPQKGYVYVASIDSNPNLCKIGFTTKNPEIRVSELKNDYKDLGFEFSLFNFVESERPKRQENLSHEVLSDVIYSREIFSVSPSLGFEVVKRCSNKWFKVISKSEKYNTNCLSDRLYNFDKENRTLFIKSCNEWFEENNVRHIRPEQVGSLERFVMEAFK